MEKVIAEKRQELENLEASNNKYKDATERIRIKLEKTKQLLQETAQMTGDLAEKLHCDTYVMHNNCVICKIYKN